MTRPRDTVRSGRSSTTGSGRGSGRAAAPERWAAARAATGRGAGKGLVVAVTGADRGLGASLTAALTERPGIAELRALPTGETAIADRLRGADVLVALEISFGAEAGAGNVAAAAAALDAAGEVPRVVLCTSAMVYGADEANSLPLDEDAPLRAMPERGLVADLMEIEELAAAFRPGAADGSLTVLRPAMLVGRGADTALTRHFEAPRLLHLQGARPAWQFCHVDDLLGALEWAALGKVAGAVTVACEGWLDQEDVEAIVGMRRIVLPASLAFGAAERLARLGVSAAPASELRYVAYPWAVSSARLQAAGWRPKHDNVSALHALLADIAGRDAAGGRRLVGRDASLGAAGAAVAMMGTAALLRQARRRRR